jgi:hypothetical protein
MHYNVVSTIIGSACNQLILHDLALTGWQYMTILYKYLQAAKYNIKALLQFHALECCVHISIASKIVAVTHDSMNCT